jgi:hypothetical protein
MSAIIQINNATGFHKTEKGPHNSRGIQECTELPFRERLAHKVAG